MLTTTLPNPLNFDLTSCFSMPPRYHHNMAHRDAAQSQAEAGGTETEPAPEESLKTYACSYCGRTFSRLGNFKRHVRSHTGEKPYTCSVCGRGFSCPTGLKAHFRTHTGEKPWACKLCPAAFADPRGLKRHTERLHSGVQGAGPDSAGNISGKAQDNTGRMLDGQSAGLESVRNGPRQSQGNIEITLYGQSAGLESVRNGTKQSKCIAESTPKGHSAAYPDSSSEATRRDPGAVQSQLLILAQSDCSVDSGQHTSTQSLHDKEQMRHAQCVRQSCGSHESMRHGHNTAESQLLGAVQSDLSVGSMRQDQNTVESQLVNSDQSQLVSLSQPDRGAESTRYGLTQSLHYTEIKKLLGAHSAVQSDSNADLMRHHMTKSLHSPELTQPGHKLTPSARSPTISPSAIGSDCGTELKHYNHIHKMTLSDQSPELTHGHSRAHPGDSPALRQYSPEAIHSDHGVESTRHAYSIAQSDLSMQLTQHIHSTLQRQHSPTLKKFIPNARQSDASKESTHYSLSNNLKQSDLKIESPQYSYNMTKPLHSPAIPLNMHSTSHSEHNKELINHTQNATEPRHSRAIFNPLYIQD